MINTLKRKDKQMGGGLPRKRIVKARQQNDNKVMME